MKQVTLRLGDDLHKVIKIRAVMQGKSLTQHIVNLTPKRRVIGQKGT